eukprot:6184685-Heterocapsa_arctica.AAC.1
MVRGLVHRLGRLVSRVTFLVRGREPHLRRLRLRMMLARENDFFPRTMLMVDRGQADPSKPFFPELSDSVLVGLDLPIQVVLPCLLVAS